MLTVDDCNCRQIRQDRILYRDQTKRERICHDFYPNCKSCTLFCFCFPNGKGCECHSICEECEDYDDSEEDE